MSKPREHVYHDTLAGFVEVTSKLPSYFRGNVKLFIYPYHSYHIICTSRTSKWGETAVKEKIY